MENEAHIELAWSGEILSICETVDRTHPKARYWIKASSAHVFDCFCKINKIEKITSQGQLLKLSAARIMQILHKTAT